MSTSSLFSEIYLQYLESTTGLDVLTHHKIIGYFRYVSDVLIHYDEVTTNIQEVLNQFNDISSTLTFTLETETDNNINFLDISVFKNNGNIQFKIYRKPTTTNTLIPSDSNHPLEHKPSAIRYFANRLITYPVTDTYKTQEYNTVRHSTKQQISPHYIRQNTYFPQRETTHTTRHPGTKTAKPIQMGHLHKCWETGHIYHQILQEYER